MFFFFLTTFFNSLFEPIITIVKAWEEPLQLPYYLIIYKLFFRSRVHLTSVYGNSKKPECPNLPLKKQRREILLSIVLLI